MMVVGDYCVPQAAVDGPLDSDSCRLKCYFFFFFEIVPREWIPTVIGGRMHDLSTWAEIMVDALVKRI